MEIGVSRLITCVLLSVLYESCLANQHSATACYYANPRTEDLSCENDEVIELGQVMVAHNGYECELTPVSTPHCPFHLVETNHSYYGYLQNACTGKPACLLDGGYLWSTPRFDKSCGLGIRSIMTVDYICSPGENTDTGTSTSITTQIISTAPTASATAATESATAATGSATAATGSAPSSKTVTHSASAVISTTEDNSDGPTDGELTGTTVRGDELLVVKIAAPILGALTVAALIVLVICLKRKRTEASPKHNRHLIKVDLEQTNTYEDVTGPFEGEEEEAYYSAPREDNRSGNESPVSRERNVANSRMEYEQQTNMKLPAGNQKARNKKDGRKVKHRKTSHDEDDDGFYDTASVENDYYLAEPIVTDSYAVVQKNRTDDGEKFTLQETSSDETRRLDTERSSVTALTYSNEVYDTAPEKIEAVLINNDLYESTCNEESESGEEQEEEVAEFVENDLYDSS